MQAAEQRAQNSALINTFFSVLQASRGQPGQGRPGIGQIVGQAGPVGFQVYHLSFDKTLTEQHKGMQIIHTILEANQPKYLVNKTTGVGEALMQGSRETCTHTPVPMPWFNF